MAGRLWCLPVGCVAGLSAEMLARSAVVLTGRQWCWSVCCGFACQLWFWPVSCGAGCGAGHSAVVLVSHLPPASTTGDRPRPQPTAHHHNQTANTTADRETPQLTNSQQASTTAHQPTPQPTGHHHSRPASTMAHQTPPQPVSGGAGQSTCASQRHS